jgi:hypothetical protein
MKWKLKHANNQRCIISDCGEYQISRLTLSGIDYYEVYSRGERIGDARSGNEARKVAERHKKGVAA